MPKSPDGQEYERSDEEITTLFHHALRTLPLPSYNGSDTPTTKPFIEAWSDMSLNVRKTMVNLEVNTEKTTEITELVSGMKQRRDLRIFITSTWQKIDATYKVRKRTKFIIGFFTAMGVIFTAYHGILAAIEWAKLQ